ncbi:hypothetical protein Riv7116_6729 [Rivularia sp. PCC 7116]|uniref:hypothetical protein n=1 Tax=Rivularia sp. PCC 7116 TaxID=373994 RepID=UPI00029F3D31|nr:hypothetical protein [Rivularia sp. PCC 7116]AFY59049.1 hypothetical protein Riv7116_6729 [Rivularia sp. PCC 7116]
MNKKFFLTLLSSPVLFSSMVSMAVFTQPASANETVDSTPRQFTCGRKATVAVATPSVGCTRLRRNSTPNVNGQKGLLPNEVPELEFTDEESDASVTLFGCDCPACLNALRQIRGLPPMT